MPEFLAETYVPKQGQAVVDAGACRTRTAAESLTQEGTLVRFVRTIFVPEDETCFYLFEASSASVVRDVGERAGVRFERIARTVPDL